MHDYGHHVCVLCDVDTLGTVQGGSLPGTSSNWPVMQGISSYWHVMQGIPALQCKPHCRALQFNVWCRYCRHSEVLHVGLNVLKTIWAVSVGVPCQGEFWNSKRRLAVVWKFSMDNLVISGLGDLVRPLNSCSCKSAACWMPCALASRASCQMWKFSMDNLMMGL